MKLELYVLMHLRDLKEKHRVSFKDIEEKTGYAHSTIVSYFNGERRIPLSFIGDFCMLLNITMGKFYAGYDAYIDFSSNEDK